MTKKQYISFILTNDEKRFLEDAVVFEPFLQENLERIKKRGADQYIKFDAYDLFDAISALKYLQKHRDLCRDKKTMSIFINKLTHFLNLVNDSGEQLGM